VVPHETLVARDRTMTGLLLLIIGFGLGWIPYISDIGALLELIGLYFVFRGRWGYTERHRRSVVIGTTLIVIAVIATIVLVLGFTAAIFSSVGPGVSLSQLGSPLVNDLYALFIGAFLLSVLLNFGAVYLVQGLADPPTKRILWGALALNIVIGLFVLFVIVPQVANAVSQATSGATYNGTPITNLQSEELLLSLLGVLPAVLYMWGYARVRNSARAFGTGPTPFGAMPPALP
jgi:hypothetical protein